MAMKDEARTPQEQPLIPFETIDAPSQRLYVLGFYTALFFWRLYDFYNLTVDETESLWLFMKWVAIDGVFLFGLPGLKIPWLEWSSATMTVIFLLHSLLDGVLMFRIPIPLGTGLVAVTKVLYDRELAVSERRVKPGDILHNSSVILGRQIIHILPEGSALLNPSELPLCLDNTKLSVDLSLQVNQTNPILIELLRYDFETGENETVSIPASQLKKMRKKAENSSSRRPSDPLTMTYTVRQTGLYRLLRVLDETNLEVHRRSADALVVACPKALVKVESVDRCLGDLSDLSLVVEGTPPLKVRYRRLFRNKSSDISFQGIQPEEYTSPLGTSSDLVLNSSTDVQWAKSHRISVPLNETLDESGRYSYSILSVTDALENIVEYDEDDNVRTKSKGNTLIVHERPRVSLMPAKTQLQVPNGGMEELPILYSSSGGAAVQNTVHTLTYFFTPQLDLLPNGEHEPNPEVKHFVAKSANQRPRIQAPGLYTLNSISTPFCQGEVLEPASCLLVNPPEPDLTIDSEPISDKCAGNPIGLRLGVDFIGTPPFVVKYSEFKLGDKHAFEHIQTFDGLRGQMEFKPSEHGHYTFTLTEIKDAVYGFLPLKNKYVLEQDVKPSVSAAFIDLKPSVKACIDDTVHFNVQFRGEGPWNLEYEIIHNGQRKKLRIDGIEQDLHQITTDYLNDGGEYSVALTSVSDRLGCKENLQQEAKVQVRHQRSKASFGLVDGKRALTMIQGKSVSIPLRLSGEPPWSVGYRAPGDPPGDPRKEIFSNSNGFISVSQAGIYEITGVQDAQCPGSVDESTSRFEVSFVDRPQISLATNTDWKLEGDKHIVKEVCEGEEDAVDIVFRGKPPYNIRCREQAAPIGARKYSGNKDLFNVPQQNTQVKLDTAQAGSYEYVFSELTDGNYDTESKKPLLVVQQKVNPRPNAQFTFPGKVYSFCQGEQNGGEEVIPITLTGNPPFNLDVEIKQNRRSSKSEPISVGSINSHKYNLRIPHRYLLPGVSVLSIRKVRDELGCDRFPDPMSSPRVQVSVNQPPSISDLEELKMDYCVGDRINYALSGHAPFTVFYTFQSKDRKAQVSGTTFRRIAETPGNFTVTGVTDGASSCKQPTQLTKIIHEMPSVRVSQGKEKRVDIHAGSETEIVFEFGGTPPFEFTYTRSENAKKGRVGRILETKTLVTTERILRIRAGEEGTYEVVAIKDRYCAYAREDYKAGTMKGDQKLLQN